MCRLHTTMFNQDELKGGLYDLQVSNVILCLMGRYPDWEGGVTKLDSAVTEADNNPAAASPAAAELTQALINNEYSQVFVHNENTIISVLELPQNVS